MPLPSPTEHGGSVGAEADVYTRLVFEGAPQGETIPPVLSKKGGGGVFDHLRVGRIRPAGLHWNARKGVEDIHAHRGGGRVPGTGEVAMGESISARRQLAASSRAKLLPKMHALSFKGLTGSKCERRRRRNMGHGGTAKAIPHFSALRQFLFLPQCVLLRLGLPIRPGQCRRRRKR